MANRERTLTANFDGKDRTLGRTTSQMGKSVDGLGKKVDGLSGKLKTGLALAGGGAVLKFGSDSVAAFKESEEAQKRLGDAFDRFPKLADSSQAALQRLNSSLQKKTKYDDDAIASGQAVIAQFGLTGKQVEKITPLILDYASRTGKDVNAASMDMGKALLGNAKALKNIGIKYQATGDTAKDFANIQALMSKQVGGFAEKEGTTAAGKAAILKNQYGELQEQVGSKLVPALNFLAAAGLKVIGWLENPAIARSVMLFAGVAGAVAAVNLATKGWTAAVQAWQSVQKVATGVQLAFNAAMSANPVMLVVAGIAALAAGVYLAYQKVGWFRAGVDAGWQALQKLWDKATGTAKAVMGALSGAFSWVKSNWPLLLAILTGPFGLAVLAISKHKDKIVGFVKAIPDAVKGFFSGLGGAISSPFTSAVDKIREYWNRYVGGKGFKAPSWVPGIGGKGFTIPKLAQGAFVRARVGGTLARLAEAGQNEIALPEPKMRSWLRAAVAAGRGGFGGGVLQPVPVVIELDGQVLGRAMIRFDADHRDVHGRGAFDGG